MKKFEFKRIISGLLLSVLLLPNFVFAEFNPNYIISDQELVDYDSMSPFQIQRFLESKGGALSWHVTVDTDGLTRSAAEIIWRAAQSYKVNPKVILVTLQKEQSLITTRFPTQFQYDWAAGYGVCDGCSTADPALFKYKGFANQVDGAAGWKRWYLDNVVTLSWLKQPGQTYLIDNYEITPINFATASFYTYTPHYNGNYNFWKIWQNWFGRFYPDGSVLKEADGDSIWLIQRGQRRQFLTYSSFISRYSPEKLISVTQSDLENYEIGPPIKFADYSLLRSPGGTVYLLVGDMRRGIASAEVFRTIGFNPDEIIDVTWDELGAYAESEPITIESVYPLGALLQDKMTGGVYFVENGIKKPLWGKEFLTLYFKGRSIIPVSSEELQKYQTGEPIKFRDGELVMSQSSPTVYVISNSERRPIPTEEVFNELGYKWENIIKTTDKLLSLHPLGSPIYLSGETEITIMNHK